MSRRAIGLLQGLAEIIEVSPVRLPKAFWGEVLARTEQRAAPIG